MRTLDQRNVHYSLPTIKKRGQAAEDETNGDESQTAGEAFLVAQLVPKAEETETTASDSKPLNPELLAGAGMLTFSEETLG